MKCYVGIDDTDSANGLCTTYLAYTLASQPNGNYQITSYPRLVRLNPNIPFKTRGNASVCLEIDTDDPKKAFDYICSRVTELSDTKNGANTGVVFLTSTKIMRIFNEIYSNALYGVLNKRRVERILAENYVKTFTLGNGMGIVGASAAIGFDPSYDHTFELIAYRRREYWGKKRDFSIKSLIAIDRAMFPNIFNNYDYEKERALIAPHGPDPVFLGIRGNSPSSVLQAFNMLSYNEPLIGYMIYITNQCTDAHLKMQLDIPLKAYYSGWIEGTIESIGIKNGGHVYIAVNTSKGVVWAAVYKPTGDLQRVARLLIKGDIVRIYGGVRRPSKKHGKIVNAEKIEVIKVNKQIRKLNPLCRRCGRRMKSEGEGKGFQCKSCGSKKMHKEEREIYRSLVNGIYLPSPRAHRHLTKPFARYGMICTKQHELIADWICNYDIIPLKGLAQSH